MPSCCWRSPTWASCVSLRAVSPTTASRSGPTRNQPVEPVPVKRGCCCCCRFSGLPLSFCVNLSALSVEESACILDLETGLGRDSVDGVGKRLGGVAHRRVFSANLRGSFKGLLVKCRSVNIPRRWSLWPWKAYSQVVFISALGEQPPALGTEILRSHTWTQSTCFP